MPRPPRTSPIYLESDCFPIDCEDHDGNFHEGGPPEDDSTCLMIMDVITRGPAKLVAEYVEQYPEQVGVSPEGEKILTLKDGHYLGAVLCIHGEPQPDFIQERPDDCYLDYLAYLEYHPKCTKSKNVRLSEDSVESTEQSPKSQGRAYLLELLLDEDAQFVAEEKAMEADEDPMLLARIAKLKSDEAEHNKCATASL